MQLGPTKILICPFCGGKKGVITLLSGNTLDGTVWSDTRRYYPMMPELSPIQKCPHCYKFYFIDQAESHYIDDITLLQDSDKGIKNLSVAEALMAVKQMENISLTKTQRWELRHQYFLAYNDAYRRHPDRADSSPTPEETELFHEAIDALLDGIDSTDEFILFHAELPHGDHLPVLILLLGRDPNISVLHIAPPSCDSLILEEPWACAI